MLVGLKKRYKLALPYTRDVMDSASLSQRIINALITRSIDHDADVATIAYREGGLHFRIYKGDTVMHEKSYRGINEYTMDNVCERLELMAAAKASTPPNTLPIWYNDRNYTVRFAISSSLIRFTFVPK